MRVSVIVPIFKSASTLVELHERLGYVSRREGWWLEVLYVDDASPDHSIEILKSLPDEPKYHIIRLARNKGQSSALLCGMIFAKGDWLVTMDADLQDRPEQVPDLLRACHQDSDVLFAQRSGRYETHGRTLTSSFFKTLVHLASGRRIPKNVGLFMVIRREAAQQLTSYLPYHPYLIGLIAKLHLRCSSISTQRSPNERGETSYSFKKRIKVATLFFRTLNLQNPYTQEEVHRWLESQLLK